MARIRVSRVGEQIKKELGQILQKEMKDPRIGFATVTAVEMSGDLQIAKIYISVLENKDETLSALEKAKGFIRSEIGKRVRLKHVPELTFIADDSLEHSEHISRLLKDVENQELDK